MTGPIGAGKSVVAVRWQELGAGVVEGDVVGKLALETDPGLQAALIDRFGTHIVDSAGQIVRAKLADAAFGSPQNQIDLTRITFPVLYRIACEKMTSLANSHKIIVFDAALIFEWGIEKDFDRIVVVSAVEEVLIRNSSRRLGISITDAEERLSRQISALEKVRRADFIITNDGTIDELRLKAEEVWKLLGQLIYN